MYPKPGSTEAFHHVLFFLIYLNTVEDGGETNFIYQKSSAKPVARRLVMAPAGFSHTHRGRTPRSDKYILTSWISFRPM